MPTHIDMKTVLCIAVLPGVLGCAAMKDFGQSLDGGGTEQVKGVYHVEKVSKDKFKGVPPSYIRTVYTHDENENL